MKSSDIDGDGVDYCSYPLELSMYRRTFIFQRECHTVEWTGRTKAETSETTADCEQGEFDEGHTFSS